MNSILTPEESAQFVTYGDLIGILQELGKNLQSLEEYRDEDTIGALGKVFDTIAEIEYRRVRDVRFYMCLVADFGYIPYEKILKRYNSWCEEYDALNKGEKHVESN